jgi:hypothetical protein
MKGKNKIEVGLFFIDSTLENISFDIWKCRARRSEIIASLPSIQLNVALTTRITAHYMFKE